MRRALPTLAVAFCLGAATRFLLPTSVGTALLLLTTATATALLLIRSPWRGTALTAAVFFLGLLRASVWFEEPLRSVVRLADRKSLAIEGFVCREATRRPDVTVFDVSVQSAITRRGREDAVGRVRVALAPAAPPPGYGRRVRVSGRLRLPDHAANPGEVPTGHYLRRDGVCATVRADDWEPLEGRGGFWLAALSTRAKARLSQGIAQTLDENEAALLRGLLFSETATLPSGIDRDFIRSGTVHILSTSGLHIALLAGLFTLVWRSRTPASRRLRSLVLLAALVFFALMTGLRPAVLRAVLMSAIVLLAPLVEREPDTWSSIALAALVLVALSPGNLRDPGFQLTFSAVAALALWADIRPSLRGMPPTKRRMAAIRETVMVSVIASAATAPVGAMHFGTVSFAAPVANLLVVPAVAPAMALGLLQGILHPAWPAAAVFLAGLNNVFLRWMLAVTSAISRVPFAASDAVYVSSGFAALLLCALFAFMWAVGVRRKTGPTPATTLALYATPALILAVLAGGCLKPRPLVVTVLDVGQGDSILIVTPSGRAMLVDAGGDDSGGGDEIAERSVLPALKRAGVRKLDVLLTTHAHDDHTGGVAAVLKAGPTGLWLHGEEMEAGPGLSAGVREARRRGVPRRKAAAGSRLMLDRGVTLDLLVPPRRLLAEDGTGNNASIGLLMAYGDTRFLLAGDAGAEEETAWLRDGAGLRADVLKVGHHGAATSSTLAFLMAVRPRWAVISCGRNNRYGHPDASTLARLRMVGARVARTDEDGGIRCVSDGRSVTVTDSRWALP
jgi:competence protein ComEC